MRSLTKLFGRSPFGLLQTHMKTVKDCVDKVPDLFKQLEKGDQEAINQTAREISKLEHVADMTKNDMRKNLEKGMFLPVDRGRLLEILTIQDNLADKAEDIGHLLTVRAAQIPPGLVEDFRAFLAKNLECFQMAFLIIDQLDELMEYTFGGREAIKVNQMVDEVAYKEHEADKLQLTLLRNLFNSEAAIDFRDFILIKQVITEISNLSNLSEKLAYRVRLMLDIK